MGLKQLILVSGEINLVDVPPPQLEDGFVLVQLLKSCISVGTEISSIKASGIPLWKRALDHPKKVKKLLDIFLADGLATATNLVKERINEEIPIGYSGAGIVVGVGVNVENLKVGDRVACAGAQFSHHAEIIRVPKNLIVRIPETVTYDEASLVALGSIALHGVRRLNPTLGESFAVIGLGVLGQLTTQILKANGCQVIAIDLDVNRVDLASKYADWGLNSGDDEFINQVHRLTGGQGVDGVIITAASNSDQVISNAFKISRKKGRVVLVGDVGLNLRRSDFYQKEIDFYISSSYGPGRYDKDYEEGGQDYPISYVRWTENRNMAEFVRLISLGLLDIQYLITDTFPLHNAIDAYKKVEFSRESLAVLLEYSPQKLPIESKLSIIRRPAHKIKGCVALGLIGAGNFSRATHLPNLTKNLKSDFQIDAVVTRNGINARKIAKEVNARYCSTDYRDILSDNQIDAVLIATRHNTHASILLDAIKSGKHVFVEKPLALNIEEIIQIEDFYKSTASGLPILMTGFNRRFSPFAKKIKSIIGERVSPLIINYRMNAGYIPLDHWVHGEEGGGRNRGEACHIYDLFTFFTQSRYQSLYAKSIQSSTKYYSGQDNFVATISYQDGSICNLTYTALGSSEFAKEEMEIYVDGMVIHMSDYKLLTVSGSKSLSLKAKVADKGQVEEMKAFGSALKEGKNWPILLWEQLQATKLAIEIDKLI